MGFSLHTSTSSRAVLLLLLFSINDIVLVLKQSKVIHLQLL